MTATPKTLFRGAATTDTATVLYTVPAATTAVVTSIVIANPANTSATFTIFFADAAFAPTITIGGLDATVLDIKQVLSAAQTIKGGASATDLIFHISGVEIA
jgi:hypothetical protein